MNYREAVAKLGKRDSVKLERNTYLERRQVRMPNGFELRENIVVRLHATDIVTFTPTWFELNTGGWHTVTTAQRMRSWTPIDIHAQRNGWNVFLCADDLTCWCESDRSSDGIIVLGERAPGMTLDYTGSRDEATDKPVYRWKVCQWCNGTTKRSGIDYGSGGYPYFDGIRIAANGKRLMARQPNKPETWEPVRTVSGWSGLPRARRAHEPFYAPTLTPVEEAFGDPRRGFQMTPRRV